MTRRSAIIAAMSEERDIILDRPEKKREYHVEGFDGPLDLLLELIKKNNLNIYNIDISLITSEFLAYLDEHGAELTELADFYQMAAELLYIKSRMLLPIETEGDDDDFEDPRQDLVDRLIEYQKYRKYTELLINGRNADVLRVERNENFFLVPFEGKDLFRGVTLDTLMRTFAELISKSSPSSKIFNVYEEVSLDEKKALLIELLDTKEKFTLDDLIVHPDDRMHIICAFMAILEAARNQMIILYQAEEYGTIYIMKRPADWDPAMADEYDDDYDVIEEEHLEDPSDFSILTKEAEEKLRAEEEEEKEEEVEFTGAEEEIDLVEDEGEDDGPDNAQ